MKKIKIAQIGTSKNSHGNQIWRSLNKLTDCFEVVGYAFPENEREKFPKQAEAFAGYREMTVEEILSDPEIEAVAVETEEIYLTKYALMVAQAGKQLHMEKPGSPDHTEFCRLVELLRSKGLVFSTGYMYRFNPLVREAIEKVRRGELGQIFSVEAQMNCKHTPDIREWLSELPSGMLYFLGCHLIDLVLQIQGEPTEVLPLSCSTGIGGIGSTDFGMAVLKYPNGVSFVKTCDNECGGMIRRQLVISGEKGTIEIKPLEVPISGKGQYTAVAESYDDSGLNWGAPWSTRQTDLFDRYDGMMKNFAELVRGKENPYSYDYEIKLHELLLKCCGKDADK